MSASFIPKRPVVTAYPKMPQAFAEAEAMAAYLKEKGIDAPCDSLYNEALRNRVKKGEFDMLITVGGDGGVLRAGRVTLGVHSAPFIRLIHSKSQWQRKPYLDRTVVIYYAGLPARHF